MYGHCRPYPGRGSHLDEASRKKRNKNKGRWMKTGQPARVEEGIGHKVECRAAHANKKTLTASFCTSS